MSAARAMNDYVQWVKRAETAEAEAVRLTLEVERLKRAFNDLAEAAEVAAQGGIHGALIDGSIRGGEEAS